MCARRPARAAALGRPALRPSAQLVVRGRGRLASTCLPRRRPPRRRTHRRCPPKRMCSTVIGPAELCAVGRTRDRPLCSVTLVAVWRRERSPDRRGRSRPERRGCFAVSRPGRSDARSRPSPGRRVGRRRAGAWPPAARLVGRRNPLPLADTVLERCPQEGDEPVGGSPSAGSCQSADVSVGTVEIGPDQFSSTSGGQRHPWSERYQRQFGTAVPKPYPAPAQAARVSPTDSPRLCTTPVDNGLPGRRGAAYGDPGSRLAVVLAGNVSSAI